jgi:glycosyltransferase involved in cell wall biosynthesis
MRDTTVVIPCYNEADRLDTGAFLGFARADDSVSFLFVNDGSTDRTQEVLEGLQRADPGAFRVLRLERNAGKGEAVRRGVLLALESGPAYVGYWDADLATPLGVIAEFRGLLDDRSAVEAVLGARVRLLGRDIRRSPKRHYLGRAFATAASLALGLGVYDAQCGAKLFRASAATAMLFREPFRSTWVFDVEILARMIRARRAARQPEAAQALVEFPLPYWRDVAGSKLRARHFLRAPLDLLTIYLHYLAGAGTRVGDRPGSVVPRPHLGASRPAPRPITRPPGRRS